MPYLNPTEFAAIKAAMIDVHEHGESFETRERTEAAIAMMTKAEDAIASPGLRDLANEQYGSDEIEIDDEGVGTSEADDGTWVQAWVWVTRDDMAEAGLVDDD